MGTAGTTGYGPYTVSENETMKDIKPIQFEDDAQLESLIAADEPFVLRGVADEFEMLSRWPTDAEGWLASLSSICGTRMVPVVTGLMGDRGYVKGSQLPGQPRMLATTLSGMRRVEEVVRDLLLIERHEVPNFLYVHSTSVAEYLPEIEDMLSQLRVPRGAQDGDWRLWVSSGRNSIHCHYDKHRNLSTVLLGNKTFVLFPPEQLPNLYVSPMEGAGYGTPASLVDVLEPDFERHPRYRRALESALRAVLGPGDTLFIPSCWWHYVETRSLCAAVNVWWKELSNEEYANANAVFLSGLLWLRDLPRHWRRIWRAQFEHFIFALDGDPYAHLSPECQGYAGAATPESLERIQRLLAAHRRLVPLEERVVPTPAATGETAAMLGEPPKDETR